MYASVSYLSSIWRYVHLYLERFGFFRSSTSKFLQSVKSSLVKGMVLFMIPTMISIFYLKVDEFARHFLPLTSTLQNLSNML